MRKSIVIYLGGLSRGAALTATFCGMAVLGVSALGMFLLIALVILTFHDIFDYYKE